MLGIGSLSYLPILAVDISEYRLLHLGIRRNLGHLVNLPVRVALRLQPSVSVAHIWTLEYASTHRRRTVKETMVLRGRVPYRVHWVLMVHVVYARRLRILENAQLESV